MNPFEILMRHWTWHELLFDTGRELPNTGTLLARLFIVIAKESKLLPHFEERLNLDLGSSKVKKVKEETEWRKNQTLASRSVLSCADCANFE